VPKARAAERATHRRAPPPAGRCEQEKGARRQRYRTGHVQAAPRLGTAHQGIIRDERNSRARTGEGRGHQHDGDEPAQRAPCQAQADETALSQGEGRQSPLKVDLTRGIECTGGSAPFWVSEGADV
jgi:hypothetical protein